jgi:hypothetical protein
VIGIGLGLWMLCALLIGAARQIGHEQATEKMPLPAADGAWQGLKFYDMDTEAIHAALMQRPDLTEFTDAGTPGSYYLTVSRRDAEALAIVLFASPDFYSLSRNWFVPDSPPLMRVGDVILALGTPDQVQLAGSGIGLRYTARNLEVLVDATSAPGYRKILRAGDTVLSLMVGNPLYAYSFLGQSGLVPAAWEGFGLYDFQQ